MKKNEKHSVRASFFVKKIGIFGSNFKNKTTFSPRNESLNLIYATKSLQSLENLSNLGINSSASVILESVKKRFPSNANSVKESKGFVHLMFSS